MTSTSWRAHRGKRKLCLQFLILVSFLNKEVITKKAGRSFFRATTVTRTPQKGMHGIQWRVKGGRVPSLTAKNLPKIGKRKSGKSGKIGKKKKNRKDSFTLPLLTDRAGYATDGISPVRDALKPGGYSHIKTYGDVPPFWVGFLQEISRHGYHFSLKNP